MVRSPKSRARKNELTAADINIPPQTTNNSKTEKVTHMKRRDLYNRQELLTKTINRLDELDAIDKKDIMTLVNFQNDKQNELLWINRCITALIVLRRKLKKSFKDASAFDIREVFDDIEKNGYLSPSGERKQYAGSTDEKFRIIIKLFYKVVYGKNKFYPIAVEWLSTKVRKGKYSKRIDANMFLSEEEVIKLIDKAPSDQKRAMFGCWYECGARPEEFLNLTNQDILYDTKGIRVILRGKTGERIIRLAVYGNLLQHWLDVHPRKNESQFYLWVSEATNFKNKPLGLRGAEKAIAEAVKLVNPNKNPVPYILRHSRATFLAKMDWKEAKLKKFFGWSDDSNKPAIYMHLSGQDLDDDILALNGDSSGIKSQEPKIKISRCIRCQKELIPEAKICWNCALPTSLEQVYLEGINSREEVIGTEEIKSQLQKLGEQDREHQHRWNYMIHIFESLTGVPLTKLGISDESFRMSNLLYEPLEQFSGKERRKLTKYYKPLKLNAEQKAAIREIQKKYQKK